jgi:hypothetical protein
VSCDFDIGRHSRLSVLKGKVNVNQNILKIYFYKTMLFICAAFKLKIMDLTKEHLLHTFNN